jgi:hypothetical protein
MLNITLALIKGYQAKEGSKNFPRVPKLTSLQYFYKDVLNVTYKRFCK